MHINWNNIRERAFDLVVAAIAVASVLLVWALS